MSRIGKKPIALPTGVTATVESGVLSDAEAREQNVGGEVLAEVF